MPLLKFFSPIIFFLCSPDCPKLPRTSFPFYKFFYPIISARMPLLKVFGPILFSLSSSFFLSKFQLQIDKRIRSSTSRIILLLNNGCHTLEQNDLAMLKIFEDKSMVDELL